MTKKVESFEVVDGKEVLKVALLQVDANLGRKALAEYNRAFGAAVKSGALLRSALHNTMKEQGIWNEDKEEEYKILVERIRSNTDKLARGGIKLSDAKTLAIDTRNARFELRELITERTTSDANTAEGQAENARFNFLVSEATVNDTTGEKIFKDMDDFLSRSTTPVALEAAQRLGQLLYGLDPDYERNLPENKFLKKWNFVDNELRFVNKDGHLVDDEGRLVNEEGRYVDQEGNYVDVDGNPLDEDGELKIEAEPFLDDEGNPLEDPNTSPASDPEVFGGKSEEA